MMMSVAQSQELKAKLQTKGKVRPHKMVRKKETYDPGLVVPVAGYRYPPMCSVTLE